jgi:predicted HNH restriction endonuclease
MGKKLEGVTPRYRIRSLLKQLWLRSKERAAALKRDGYTCQCCHTKQSKAKGKEFKVEVHHVDGITDWEGIIDIIYKQILVHHSKLKTLCPDCHSSLHKEEHHAKEE